jgi:hypothetical protein
LILHFCGDNVEWSKILEIVKFGELLVGTVNVENSKEEFEVRVLLCNENM